MTIMTRNVPWSFKWNLGYKTRLNTGALKLGASGGSRGSNVADVELDIHLPRIPENSGPENQRCYGAPGFVGEKRPLGEIFVLGLCEISTEDVNLVLALRDSAAVD